MRRLVLTMVVFGASCIEAQETNPFGAGRLQDAPSFQRAGASWPVVPEDTWSIPTPDRIFYVAPGGNDGAFGGADEPWADLQLSLCKLRSGDRLMVRPGTYTGPFAIDGDCRNAPQSKVIEVVGEPGARLIGGPALDDASGFWNPVLVVNRSGWVVRGFEVNASAYEGVGVQVLADAGQTQLRDMVILESGPAGISVGPNTSDLTVRNVVVRDGQGANGGMSHGVLLFGGCQTIRLVANFLHHNSGDGVHLLGNHVVPFEVGSIGALNPARNVTIEGNSIHDNRGHAVVVGASVDVAIKNNTVWNGRPSPVGEGVGIELHDGATTVSVEDNLLVEVTQGIVVHAGARLDARPDGAVPPSSILVERNLIQNPVTPGRLGFLIDHAVDVRLYHNAVARVRKALVVYDLPPKTDGLRVLNNLFLEASELGFRTSGMAVFDRFDFNAFGLGAGAVQSEIGEARQSIASQVEEGLIPDSYVVAGAGFDQGDLAHPSGVQVVDKGTPIPGFSYEGPAPDLGPYEHPPAQ